MDNNKIIENTREALEEHIKLIIRKGGNMSPPDIDFLTKDICALEALKRIENYDNPVPLESSYSRGHSMNSNSTRYYDGASRHNGYSGHSIQDRMIDCLEHMIDDAQTDYERQTVKEWISRLKA